MHCPQDKKLVLALGSAVLGLIFWVAGMAIDAKIESSVSEGLILTGAILMLFALICGARSAQRHLGSSLNHRLLDERDEESGMMRQRMDGRLSPVLER